MTHRERILAACRGEVPDRIPWVPRLDLWYNAHSRARTLPGRFAGASLREITDALGVGYHAVVPNFLDVRSSEDIADCCLGIYRLKHMPFETRLEGVERELAPEGDMTRVTYRTPAGTITGVFGYTPEMKDAGVSLPWIREHVVKRPEDYAVPEYIYSRLGVIAACENYRAWQEWVGDDGVAVGFGNLSASPMHHLLHEVMPAAEFFMEMYDHPAELEAVNQALGVWFEKFFRALAESPAEMVFVGGNFDATITYPPFFERHILPWTARLAGMLHEKGKLLLVHTDGENAGLVELYGHCGFDVADSLCPAPMTSMTLEEFAGALPGVTVWGGIPSVALCSESMSDRDFDELADKTVAFARGRSRIVLGVADTTPPGASFERIVAITERVNR
ncbi:MAG TPA: hypothetical protein ENN09_03575 [Planctomycetes bacterium]|nr:hypothetical protein [Planctomycetota bacterium]